MICAATTWGWMQSNKEKDLSNLSFARFCDKIGIKLTTVMANATNPILFRLKLVNFKNIHQTIQGLNKNPTDKELMSVVGMAIRDIGEILPETPIETLKTVVMNADKEIIPSKKSPIKDLKYREQSQALCGILCVLPDVKAPS